METVLALIGYIVIPYFILLISYRLFFHPLRHVPGPFLAKISDCYVGYYAIKQSLHLATCRDCVRYGRVMRYGPNRLGITDIYKNPRVTKSTLYLFSRNENEPFVFNTLDRDAHARKRRIIAPALSERSMRLFESTMVAQVDLFLARIASSSVRSSDGESESESEGKRGINIAPRSRRLAMDVAGRMGFGYDLGLQRHEGNKFILDGIAMANYRINAYMNFPFLSKLGFDLILKRSPVRPKWRGLVGEMIRTRLSAAKGDLHDFYAYVADGLEGREGEGEKMEHGELFAESLFFMSAGGDTVSSAIAGLFFYLSRNPSCYAKLANEIRSTFTNEEDIRSGPKLSSCRYFRACIDETLRMSPPITGTLWRQLAHDDEQKPLVIDGQLIPPGTHFGVSAYAMHHNEEYFRDPYTFLPERWMQATSDPNSNSTSNSNPDEVEEKKDDGIQPHNPRAFIPFSTGARSCAGKPMAYLEMSLVMAKTLFRFDYERFDGEVGGVGAGGRGLGDKGRMRMDEFQLYDTLTSRHDGPYLVFRPRGCVKV
ncbi:cytochrome P450 [Xylariaceae sp. FL0594]|nr:cytochrome P450 [Xylariaceae sp. FL0594]